LRKSNVFAPGVLQVYKDKLSDDTRGFNCFYNIMLCDVNQCTASMLMCTIMYHLHPV